MSREKEKISKGKGCGYEQDDDVVGDEEEREPN